MPEGYFKKLLKKGWDPGHFVEVQPDDYVTLGERLIQSGGVLVGGMAIHERRRCVILSKGPEDRNRRIVAQGDGWVIGLWIAMLRRQLKTGTIDIKAWSFEVLTGLERDDAYFRIQADNWTQELLKKETP